MDRRERVMAAAAGRPVDRPPVSAWRHFVDREQSAGDLAAAMLEFQRDFDWDFMKVNPRATCFAEAWGNRYDFGRYVSVLPTPTEVVLKEPADLARIRPVDPAGGAFGEQLDALGRIARGLDGEVPFIQTIFSPLSVIGFLTGGPAGYAVPGLGDALPRLRRFIQEDPEALEAALDAVASSLAGYARAVLETGASGIFFAIVRLARAPALTREEYERFGRAYDMRVLEAVRGRDRFNVLHVCGDQIYYADTASYPVQAISWNTESAGNPSLAQMQAHTLSAVMGGVGEDGVLLEGSPADVTAAVTAALAETGGHRTIVAPGCSVIPATPLENLRAMRDAVASGR
jgi:uroporphyrinogen decarboxylase